MFEAFTGALAVRSVLRGRLLLFFAGWPGG
jgi:hypothetical protein